MTEQIKFNPDLSIILIGSVINKSLTHYTGDFPDCKAVIPIDTFLLDLNDLISQYITTFNNNDIKFPKIDVKLLNFIINKTLFHRFVSIGQKEVVIDVMPHIYENMLKNIMATSSLRYSKYLWKISKDIHEKESKVVEEIVSREETENMEEGKEETNEETKEGTKESSEDMDVDKESESVEAKEESNISEKKEEVETKEEEVEAEVEAKEEDMVESEKEEEEKEEEKEIIEDSQGSEDQNITKVISKSSEVAKEQETIQEKEEKEEKEEKNEVEKSKKEESEEPKTKTETPEKEVEQEEPQEHEEEKELSAKEEDINEESEDEEQVESKEATVEEEQITQRPGTRKRSRSPSAYSQHKRFQNIAVKLITTIQEHRFSSPFLQAVNKRDAPDYYEIIYEPKDLKTILKAVKSKKEPPVYQSIKQLERDIMLMFANCIMYNKSDDDLVQLTISMKEEVRNIFKIFEEAEEDMK